MGNRSQAPRIGRQRSGVPHAASCAIHTNGAAYAILSTGQTKHGIKEVDHLFGNDGFEVRSIFDPWARFVIAEREEFVVALDWTDFEKHEQTALCAYLVTPHGWPIPFSAGRDGEGLRRAR